MRTTFRRLFAVTCGAAAVAGAAVPATASSFELSMQDDFSLLDGAYNRDVALLQFKALGGTHVRIIFDHARGAAKNSPGLQPNRPIEQYDGAIDAVRAFGMEPQLVLVYRGQKSPKRWKAWTRTVAEHYGDKVERYSIGNEPDLYEVERRSCTKSVQRKFKKQFKKDIVRGKRAKVITKNKTVPVLDACNRYQRGLQYKRIFGPAADGIEAGNKSAQILAGETSPNSSLDWFFKAVKPKTLKRKGADGWAQHPYQFQDLTPGRRGRVWGLGYYKDLRKIVRMPIYFTEAGYPKPGSAMDDQYYDGTLTDEKVTKALVASWKIAKRTGARQMNQYQWFTKPPYRGEVWDTSILVDDSGATTPQYDALLNLTQNW